MKKERRSRERRTPAGACVTCHHSAGDHLDGRGACVAAGGCNCRLFAAAVGRPARVKKEKAVKATARKKR